MSEQKTDEQLIAELMERKGTHRDVARLVIPHLTDQDADYVLWEMTPFPLMQGVALMPYLRRAAEELATGQPQSGDRAARNNNCCEHVPSDHDLWGCAVNVSTNRRAYERCHVLVPADTHRADGQR